jgi:uncharacterized protein (TIRG00374 family)
VRPSDSYQLKKALAPGKVLLPLIIGVGAAWWLLDSSWDDLVRDPSTGVETTTRELMGQFQWSRRATWALLAALACVLIRDAAYMLRLRILGMQALNWRSCFSSIILWEFASALTPSVVGGSAAAVLILRREGLPVGRSVATVLVTALMDEVFYILAVPITALLVVGSGGAFFPQATSDWPVEWLFSLAYGFILLLTVCILLGMIIAPRSVARWLDSLFSRRLLSRWRGPMSHWTSDWIVAAESFKGSGAKLWAQAVLTTALSWTARFLTLNCLLLVFFESIPHAQIMARQLLLWIILMISPTPGSSGFAEVALPQFIGDLTGLAYLGVVAILWRLFTYFPYLFAGALILPMWLKRTKNHSKQTPRPQQAS